MSSGGNGNVCLKEFIQAYISAVDRYPLYIVSLGDIWYQALGVI
jgi:hypothetical protein